MRGSFIHFTFILFCRVILLAPELAIATATPRQCLDLQSDLEKIEGDIDSLNIDFEGRQYTFAELSKMMRETKAEDEIAKQVDTQIYKKDCESLIVGACAVDQTEIKIFEALAQTSVSWGEDEEKKQGSFLDFYFDQIPYVRPKEVSSDNDEIGYFRGLFNYLNNDVATCKTLISGDEKKAPLCHPGFRQEFLSQMSPLTLEQIQSKLLDDEYIRFLTKFEKSSLSSDAFVRDAELSENEITETDSRLGVSLSKGMTDQEKILFYLRKIDVKRSKELLLEAATDETDLGWLDAVLAESSVEKQLQALSSSTSPEDMSQVLKRLESSSAGQKAWKETKNKILPNGYSKCIRDNNDKTPNSSQFALSYIEGEMSRAEVQLACQYPDKPDYVDVINNCPKLVDVALANPEIQNNLTELERKCYEEMSPLTKIIEDRRGEITTKLNTLLQSTQAQRLHQMREMILHTGDQLCNNVIFSEERPYYCQYLYPEPYANDEFKALFHGVAQVLDKQIEEANRPGEIEFFATYCQGKIPSYLKTTCELRADDLRIMKETYITTNDVESSDDDTRAINKEIAERAAVSSGIRQSIGKATMGQTLHSASKYGGALVSNITQANSASQYGNYYADSLLAYQEQLSFCASNYQYCYGYRPGYGYIYSAENGSYYSGGYSSPFQNVQQGWFGNKLEGHYLYNGSIYSGYLTNQ